MLINERFLNQESI